MELLTLKPACDVVTFNPSFFAPDPVLQTVDGVYTRLGVIMSKQNWAFQYVFVLFFRYFLRATVIRRLNDISKEMDIVVHTLSTYPELNSSIKMEVGIEDCLHIEFEYNKSK